MKLVSINLNIKKNESLINEIKILSAINYVNNSDPIIINIFNCDNLLLQFIKEYKKYGKLSKYDIVHNNFIITLINKNKLKNVQTVIKKLHIIINDFIYCTPKGLVIKSKHKYNHIKIKLSNDKLIYIQNGGGDTPSFLSSSKWSEFDLNPLLLKSINETFGYELMSKIQVETYKNNTKDILAKSQTGSGKTLSYLTIMLRKDPNVKAVILVPTREIAPQIANELKILTQHYPNKYNIFVASGSTVHNFTNDCDVLIGSVGSVAKIASNEHNKSFFNSVNCLVFDESDALLGISFEREIKQIMANIQGNSPWKQDNNNYRQTLFYSATMEPDIIEKSKKYMNLTNFSIIEIPTEISTVHEYIKVNPENIFMTLYNYIITEIKNNPEFKCFLFLNTKKMVELFVYMLNKYGLSCIEYTGNSTEGQRKQIMEKLHNSKSLILVCTNVAGRGLDIKDVNAVIQINYIKIDEYMQRAGRSGRAGSKGYSLILLSEHEVVPMTNLINKKVPIAERENTFLNPLPQMTLSDKDSTELQKYLSHSFRGFLGEYKGKLKDLKIDSKFMVEYVKQYYKALGLNTIPKINAKTAKKMGLYQEGIGLEFD